MGRASAILSILLAVAPPRLQSAEPQGAAIVGPVPPARDELPPAIYFERGSSALGADAFPVLNQWAAYLLSSEGKVRLRGHADARGDRDYNRWLAEQRARAALRALVALGVPRDRLQVVSAGEQSPQAFGHTEFAWSRNRRVELKLD